MNLVTYPLTTIESHERYEFLSEGPNGTIKKVINISSSGKMFPIWHLVIGMKPGKQLMTM